MIKKLLLLMITVSSTLFIYASPASAKKEYPISELGDCRDRKECYLYCLVPQNFAACWSYGKYIKNRVLGETTVSFTYPVPELGGCKNAEECFLYCKDAKNHDQCKSYAKLRGLKSTKAEITQKVITEAEKTLGCSGKDSCREFCNKEENSKKCSDFALRLNLSKPVPAMPEGLKEKLMLQAKKEFGCQTVKACFEYCQKEDNREKCRSLEYRIRKNQQELTTPPSDATKSASACGSEEECRKYCEQNPSECPGFPKKAQITQQIGFSDLKNIKPSISISKAVSPSKNTSPTAKYEPEIKYSPTPIYPTLSSQPQ